MLAHQRVAYAAWKRDGIPQAHAGLKDLLTRTDLPDGTQLSPLAMRGFMSGDPFVKLAVMNIGLDHPRGRPAPPRRGRGQRPQVDL